MNTTDGQTVKLKKIAAAYGDQAAVYATADGRYRVTCFISQSWSASRGAYRSFTWTATDTHTRGADGHLVDVASANSLEQLKLKLSRYLTDLSNGCVRGRAFYFRA